MWLIQSDARYICGHCHKMASRGANFLKQCRYFPKTYFCPYLVSFLSDTRLERTIGSGWQRGRQSEGRGCGVRCVTGLSGSIVSPFLFSNADATAGNAPSMARFRLALPSVAGHCWELQGILSATKSCYNTNAASPALCLTTVLASF